jgi:hypothetical protein
MRYLLKNSLQPSGTHKVVSYLSSTYVTISNSYHNGSYCFKTVFILSQPLPIMMSSRGPFQNIVTCFDNCMWVDVTNTAEKKIKDILNIFPFSEYSLIVLGSGMVWTKMNPNMSLRPDPNCNRIHRRDIWEVGRSWSLLPHQTIQRFIAEWAISWWWKFRRWDLVYESGTWELHLVPCTFPPADSCSPWYEQFYIIKCWPPWSSASLQV